MNNSDTINIKTIGYVDNDFKDQIPEDYKEKESRIHVKEEYEDALLGIEEHSHITVLMWFHESDRTIQRVHPMADMNNPLTGVFATRSPVRPNPIAVTVCKLISRNNNIITVKGLDGLDGTPIIDIKSYKPYEVNDIKFPDWVSR